MSVSRYLLTFVLLLAVVGFGYSAIFSLGGEERVPTYVVAAILAAVMLLILWLPLPWDSWLDAGAKELHDVGKAAAGAAKARFEPEEPGARIIGSEGFSRFSVADEMLKWKQLRDEGIVTEEEFQEARAKLLGRKP